MSYPMTPMPAYQQTPKDPDTAFLIELVGGLLGFLGVGFIYAGKTSDGLVRLIGWWIFLTTAWIGTVILIALVIGLCMIPGMIALQIGVPIWSAYSLKRQMQSAVMWAPAAPPQSAPPPGPPMARV